MQDNVTQLSEWRVGREMRRIEAEASDRAIQEMQDATQALIAVWSGGDNLAILRAIERADGARLRLLSLMELSDE